MPTPTDLNDAARYRQYAARAENVNDRTFWHNAAQRLEGLPVIAAVGRPKKTTGGRPQNPFRHRYERITWNDAGMATPDNMPDEQTRTTFENKQEVLINTAHSLVGKWVAIHDFGENGSKANRYRRVMRVFTHFIAMGYIVQRRKVSNDRRGVYEYKITQE